MLALKIPFLTILKCFVFFILQVRYAPKIQLSIVDNNEMSMDTIPEGNEAKFYCLTDANPNDVTYKWFINNELIVGDYTTEMVSI